MNLTEHFSIDELQAHTGEPDLDNICPDTLASNALRQSELLEECRVLVGPLHVNSWFRSPQVNDAVGGEEKSYHLLALATDVVPNGSTLSAFKTLVASGIQYDKIILEQRKSLWIHIQSPIDGFKPRRLAYTSKPNEDGKMVYTPYA